MSIPLVDFCDAYYPLNPLHSSQLLSRWVILANSFGHIFYGSLPLKAAITFLVHW